MLERAAAGAGLAHLNVNRHGLRHLTGHYLVKLGTDTRTTQDYLGHGHIRQMARTPKARAPVPGVLGQVSASELPGFDALAILRSLLERFATWCIEELVRPRADVGRVCLPDRHPPARAHLADPERTVKYRAGTAQTPSVPATEST
jgi:hypothetical protein